MLFIKVIGKLWFILITLTYTFIYLILLHYLIKNHNGCSFIIIIICIVFSGRSLAMWKRGWGDTFKLYGRWLGHWSFQNGWEWGSVFYLLRCLYYKVLHFCKITLNNFFIVWYVLIKFTNQLYFSGTTEMFSRKEFSRI